MTTRRRIPSCEGLPSSVAEARSAGTRYYFTGKPCVNGHIEVRYVRNCKCYACGWKPPKLNEPTARQRAKAESETRRVSHADFGHLPGTRRAAIASGIDRYFTGKPCANGHTIPRLAASFACPACKSLYGAADYSKNKDLRLEQKRLRNTPEKMAQWSSRRRARKRNADGAYKAADVRNIRALQKDKCAYCRNPLKGRGQVDHIVALARGGSNWPSNIQILCGPCNLLKRAKDPLDFARSIGLLC